MAMGMAMGRNRRNYRNLNIVSVLVTKPVRNQNEK